MKTILIATDFSPAARNASLYGIELTKALDSPPVIFIRSKLWVIRLNMGAEKYFLGTVCDFPFDF